MQVGELFDLTEWIDEHLNRGGVLSKYKSLHKKLVRNSDRNNQSLESFEEERANLIAALRETPLEQLSESQKAILEKYSSLDKIGARGAALVEDVLYVNAIDVSTAASKIGEYTSKIQELINWSSQTWTQLEPIYESSYLPELNSGEVIIRINFRETANISNLEDLRSWSKHWWEIVRGVSMLHGQAPETIRIVGASKGSLLLDLLGYAAFAKVLLSTIEQCLKAAERFQNIRLKQQEIQALKLENDAAERALDEALQAERDNRLASITQQVLASVDSSEKANGEIENGLRNSIEKLVDFIEKGGHVDFILPRGIETDDESSADVPEEIAQVRAQSEEVRKLENQIKLIEGGSN